MDLVNVLFGIMKCVDVNRWGSHHSFIKKTDPNLKNKVFSWKPHLHNIICSSDVSLYKEKKLFQREILGNGIIYFF